MLLKGEAAHLQEWVCRAEGKSIQTTWRTAGQEGNWASNFGSAALSVIMCYFREEKLICSSVDLCARQFIVEYSSGSRAYGSWEPVQIWLHQCRATTKCTGFPQGALIAPSALTKALFFPTALPVTVLKSHLLSAGLSSESHFSLSPRKDIRRMECDI